MQQHDSTAFDLTRKSTLLHSQFSEHLDATYEELICAAVLPEQFYTPPGLGVERSGHIALRWAVLTDALNCLTKVPRKEKGREQRIAKETAEWFFTDETQWPFSFINLCATLGLDPAYIRRGLLRWMQNDTHDRPRRRYTGRRSFKLAA